MPATLPAPLTDTLAGNYFISNYPPFSCWNTEDVPKFHRALGRDPEPREMAVYVHLPFCRQRCHYCYFRVYPRRQRADVERYIDAVLEEYAIYQKAPAVAGRPFSSIYFGGGSPSYLECDQIQRLLGGLQEQHSWDGVEEATFECEPGTVTLEKLRTLRRFGVTRVSIGFQSLTDQVLRRSGRDVQPSDCLEAFHLAREAGFAQINVDLLSGLQGETERTWRQSIEKALALGPDCLTVYQLELTHNSSLFGSMRAGRGLKLASWPEKRSWTGIAFDLAEAAGYTVQNGYMAGRGPDSWRLLYTVENCWHGSDLVGLGETAFGNIQGVLYQNADKFDAYLSQVEQGQVPVRRAHRLTPDETLRREVILQLKTGVIDAGCFRKKFGVELTDYFEPEFDSLKGEDLLEIDGDTIRLSRKALLKVDWLLPMFYLPEHIGVRYT
jgi:oxygen-independent coproporphyrinogen III oxidase